VSIKTFKAHKRLYFNCSTYDWSTSANDSFQDTDIGRSNKQGSHVSVMT